MKTFGSKRFLILVMLLTVGAAVGCIDREKDKAVEEILLLENDILEDPLLRMLDEVESSLLREDTVQEMSDAPREAGSSSDAPAVQSSPANAAPTPPPQEVSSAETLDAAPITGEQKGSDLAAKQVYFGIVRRVSDAGILLQVIQAKALTPEELRRLNKGEQIPLTLLTQEMLALRYSTAVKFERLSTEGPVTADAADVAKGQRVRVALNPDGDIRLLRIIRD